jgi:hypothetical protein
LIIKYHNRIPIEIKILEKHEVARDEQLRLTWYGESPNPGRDVA